MNPSLAQGIRGNWFSSPRLPTAKGTSRSPQAQQDGYHGTMMAGNHLHGTGTLPLPWGSAFVQRWLPAPPCLHAAQAASASGNQSTEQGW